MKSSSGYPRSDSSSATLSRPAQTTIAAVTPYLTNIDVCRRGNQPVRDRTQRSSDRIADSYFLTTGRGNRGNASANGLAAIADEPELELFDLDELGLPASFGEAALVPVALDHLRAIYQARFNRAANETMGNSQQVQHWTQVETQSRVALAKIKKEHPKALELAKQVAVQQDIAQKATG